MKRILELLVLGVMIFVSYGLFAQSDNLGEKVRVSIDPMVLINEGNFNIKVDFDSGTYGDNPHRIIAGLEVLTGHEYVGGTLGYGYAIPYYIGNAEFIVQPSVELGIIYRYEWEVGWFENHSLNLRHELRLTNHISLFIHNRLIRRNDLHYQNENTLTPEELPFYHIDNAVGITIHLN